MDQNLLGLPSDLSDEDLLNVNWDDVNLDSLVGLDFDLDPDKSPLLNDIGHIQCSADEPSFFNNLSETIPPEDVKPFNHISATKVYGNSKLDNVNLCNAQQNQEQCYSISSSMEHLQSAVPKQQEMDIGTSTVCPDTTISAPIISQNTSNVKLPTTTAFLQIASPPNTTPHIIKQIVTANSPPPTAPVSSLKTVIQHLVIPKTENFTQSHTAYICKGSSFATISTPLQGVDTAIVTGIPLMVETANNVPMAHLVSPSSFSGSPQSLQREKKSHNEIERRYRSSINDKIIELRNLVAGEEPKLHKSQILKKAIDYIKYLLNQNNRLRAELNMYKTKARNAVNLKRRVPTGSSEFSVGCGSPPYSDPSISPQLSPMSDVSHHQHLPSSPEFVKDIDDKMEANIDDTMQPVPEVVNRVTDRSRMVLWMVVLAVLTLNPLSFFSYFGSTNSFPDVTKNTHKRFLFNSDEHVSSVNFWSSTPFVWCLNLVVLLMFMVKFLVYGEPHVKRGSPVFKEFRRFINTGNSEMAKGNYSIATEKYCAALATVGRPLPCSFSEKFLSLLWQIWWRISIRLLIGKWLSRYAGGFFLDKKVREEMQEVTRDCVIVMNKLNKLHLMGHMEDSSHILGLYLALHSLNWSDCAQYDDDHMADILATCALRSRESLPARWNLLAKFLLLRTRMACERITTVPRRLLWLYSPKGRRFFVSHQWSYDSGRKSLFSSFDQRANPLAYLLVLYREHLLERSVRTLVNPGQKVEDACENDLNRNSVTSDVIEYLDILDDTFSSENDDEINQWWSKVFRWAACALLGQPKDDLYEAIESLPSALKNSVDPLPNAVQLSIKGRREVESGSNLTAMRFCDEASDAVEHSINISSCKEENQLLQSVQVLVLDWVLETRTSLWEREVAAPLDCDGLLAAPTPMLQGFQVDLLSLRKLINVVPGVLQRVFLHEATLRIMAGASPARTQQLLDRSLRYRYRTPSAICRKDKRNNNNDCGEREHATALMIACRHLPTQLLSSPGERAGMLSEAAKTLEKIGDLKKMRECYALMKNMSTAASQYC